MEPDERTPVTETAAGGMTSPATTLQRIGGVVAAPLRTFDEIARRPDFLLLFILYLAISVATSMINLPRIDFETGMREKLAERDLGEEDIEKQIAVMTKIQKFGAPLTLVMFPLTMLLIAGLFWLLSRLFEGEGSFVDFLSVSLYAWLPQMLKTLLATVVIVLRGKVSFEEIPAVLKSNPAFLIDVGDHPVVAALLSSVDIFTIWTLFLMIVGYAAAGRMSRTKSAWLVMPVWLVVVLFSAGAAALQGLGSK